MRQSLQVGPRFLSRVLSEFVGARLFQATSERAVLGVLRVDCHHCESLVDVVVKLSGDPGAFLLLRFNQLSAHVGKNVFGELALGDIDARAV